MIFAYVDRALGPDAVRRVLDAAGFAGVSLDEVRDPARWFTFDETARLDRAASEVCNDEAIGRRCGEELFRVVLELGMADFFAATGSVGAACRAVADYGSRMSDDRPLWVAHEAADHVLIQSRIDNPAGAQPFFCGVTAGYYSNVPSFFGHAGVVAEVECQRRGAPQCTFRLSWRPIPAATGTGQTPATPSPDLLAATVARFEQFQRTASELVGADDVGDVLERITHHVSAALDAPKYLFVARLHERDRLRIHHRGFQEGAVTDVAERVMAQQVAESEGAIVAEVSSKRRVYGHLAAFFGSGTELKPSDRRLLEAYAGHAAAALEVIASLEQARRDRDTAQVLLDLASALAQAGTVEDIAGRLGHAVPAVVDSDVASVWLKDASTERFALAGWTDTDAGAPGLLTSEYDLETLPELAVMLTDPAPVLLDADAAPAGLRPDLDRNHLVQLAVVPISSKGRLLGFVNAGFRKRLSDDATGHLLTRLTGLADHAATALENAQLLERVRHEALHDRLTGLPSRALVEDRARRAFAMGARSGHGVGLLFVDLDRFKVVNDTLGHQAGDELIRQVGERMNAQMREADTLARLGGDEFVVLLPELRNGVADAIAVAERLIASLKDGFLVAGQELFISCSVGIACAPDHGNDYESLMRYGDMAMYSAKNAGRDAFAVHACGDAAPRRSALQLETELHKAISNDELRVHYQPQIDMKTMRIASVEALARWEHPKLGLLAPGAFLALAEESGLIVDIDEWIRHQAFAQTARWHDEGHDLRVAVNLSTRALSNRALPKVIGNELAAAKLPAGSVELEVTDRVVMSDEQLPAVLSALKSTGVRVAIDDFGTGTSVLNRLQSCPVDTLKIDRSFVQAVTDASPEAPLVKAIIALAHSLDLDVVAEGVETAAQGGTVRRYGCDLAQGFLFSRPVPAADIDRLLDYQRA